MPKVLNRYKDKPGSRAVYVGRPTNWGNPFSVTEFGREEALRKFAYYVTEHPELVELAKKYLVDRDLICYCAPNTCHAELWLYVANDDIPMPEWMKGIWYEPRRH